MNYKLLSEVLLAVVDANIKAYKKLKKENESLDNAYQALEESYDKIEYGHEKLNKQIESLKLEIDVLKAENSRLNHENNELLEYKKIVENSKKESQEYAENFEKRTPVVEFLKGHTREELIGKRVFYKNNTCTGYGTAVLFNDYTSSTVGVVFDKENKYFFHSLSGKCKDNHGYWCSNGLLEIVE